VGREGNKDILTADHKSTNCNGHRNIIIFTVRSGEIKGRGTLTLQFADEASYGVRRRLVDVF
jgi:hypothetical protein